MIKGFLKDITVNETFMAQIFHNMMEDRDLFESKEWIKRYNSFIMIIVDKIIKIKGIKLSKDDRLDYLVSLSHSIYTKKYDDDINDMKNMGQPAES